LSFIQISCEELTHDNDLGEGYVIKDAKRNKIKPVYNKNVKEFTCNFDFGDHWEHAITRESVINDDIIRPFCL